MEAECIICRKHASGDAMGPGVIYENELVFASHAPAGEGASAYLGYVFVETKRHVKGLGELADDEAAAIGLLVNAVSAALRETESAEHVYSYVYGDGVPHLHVHLQARYPNTPMEFWPRRSGDTAITVDLSGWPDAPRGDAAAVRAITARLHQSVEVRYTADSSGR